MGRVSDVERDPIEQSVEAQRAEVLGDGRRIDEIHGQEDSFLEPRSVVTTGHETRQDAGTEHAFQLTDRTEQGRDEEHEADVRPSQDVRCIGEGNARREGSQQETDDDEHEVDEGPEGDRDDERPLSWRLPHSVFAATTSNR